MKPSQRRNIKRGKQRLKRPPSAKSHRHGADGKLVAEMTRRVEHPLCHQRADRCAAVRQNRQKSPLASAMASHSSAGQSTTCRSNQPKWREKSKSSWRLASNPACRAHTGRCGRRCVRAYVAGRSISRARKARLEPSKSANTSFAGRREPESRERNVI